MIKHVAGYKSLPSVEFVDALPSSPVGKVVKSELRRRYAEQVRSTQGTDRTEQGSPA
jgi:non-ribosomal peptide synthetase component E (peptide arylation enzyme)